MTSTTLLARLAAPLHAARQRRSRAAPVFVDQRLPGDGRPTLHYVYVPGEGYSVYQTRYGVYECGTLAHWDDPRDALSDFAFSGAGAAALRAARRGQSLSVIACP